MSSVDTELRVDVLKGLHAGSSTRVSGPSVTIGDDSDHDIMLLDDAFDGMQLHAAVERSVLGSFVTLTAARPGALIDGVPLSGEPEKLPCEVRVGEVVLKLADPMAPTQTRRPMGPMVLAITGAVAIGVGALAAALTSPQSSARGPMIVTAATAAQMAQAETPRASGLTWLTEQIDGSPLAGALQVAADGPNAISVTGLLPGSKMGFWQRIHEDFDRSNFAEVLLSDIRRISELPTLPPIATVRLGDAPALILAAGGTLTAGAALDGGWSLESITREGLVVKRRDEEVSIAF